MAERILLTGSTLTGSGDVLMLLARAFFQSGYETRIVSAADGLPFWSRVARDAHVSLFRTIDSVSFSRHFFQTAISWKPTIIFIYGSNVFIFPHILEKLKRKLDCRFFLWEVNNNFFGEIGLRSLPIYDHVFALDSYIPPVLQVAGAKSVSHLPACADPQEHYPIPLPNDALYHADMSFLGSPYPNRVELLKHVVNRGFSLRIYGDRWHAADPSLQPFISDMPVLGLTKSKIFTNSRISLNMQGPRMINAENFRVFEVAASAGVSFSTYKPDLVQCFTPEKEVVLFENAGDLGEKMDYYLNHPAELDAIGRAARERFLEEHTYQHRVKMIEKVIQ
jgi:spore maturation protein CgeB